MHQQEAYRKEALQLLNRFCEDKWIRVNGWTYIAPIRAIDVEQTTVSKEDLIHALQNDENQVLEVRKINDHRWVIRMDIPNGYLCFHL